MTLSMPSPLACRVKRNKAFVSETTRLFMLFITMTLLCPSLSWSIGLCFWGLQLRYTTTPAWRSKSTSTQYALRFYDKRDRKKWFYGIRKKKNSAFTYEPKLKLRLADASNEGMLIESWPATHSIGKSGLGQGEWCQGFIYYKYYYWFLRVWSRRLIHLV